MFQERRRYERVPFSADILVFETAGEGRYKGRSIDLSAGGIGFYCERFLRAGAHVRLVIPVGSGDARRTVEIDATVRWSRLGEESGGVMGAEFDCPLALARQPALCDYLTRR